MLKFLSLEKRFGLASGTLFMAFCTLVIKVLGFLYKLPLFNALGAFGMGLYQTVFPVFTLLINLAGAGVPSAMTKLIASGKNAKTVLEKSLKIFASLGFVFFVLLLTFCKKICLIQGTILAQNLYIAIAPSVLAVSLIACFRGYFQGIGNFKPTAISQLIEQVVKMIIAILFFKTVSGDYLKKATYACVAVSVSECLTLLFLIILYLKQNKFSLRINLFSKNTNGNVGLLKTALPLTLITLILPFGGFIDSLTVVNALTPTFKEISTDLYGIYAGGIQTLIGLPVNLIHALAIGFLPKMSSEKGKSGKKLLFYTAVLSAFAFIGLQIFAPLTVKILFSGFKGYQNFTLKLIRVSLVNLIYLSMLSVSNTVLLSMDDQFFPLISMPIGLIFKSIINFSLIKLPKVNLFGLILSDFCFYFIALMLNLLKIFYNLKQNVKKVEEKNNNNFSLKIKNVKVSKSIQ